MKKMVVKKEKKYTQIKNGYFEVRNGEVSEMNIDGSLKKFVKYKLYRGKG